MRLLTERVWVRDVSERWDKQYPMGSGDDKIRIGANLRGLNRETATAQDVAKIIGNDSWTNTYCAECRKHGPDAIRFENDEYEVQTDICLPCFKAAQRMVRKGRP